MGSKYATPEGARRLRVELDELWLVERPAVTRAVSEAAAMGDRSENAEYIYGKRRLREIDRRVRFLRQRLDGLQVVAGPPADRSRAFFGAWVTIEVAGAWSGVTASSVPTSSIASRVTSAWTHRSAAPCSASASAMKSRCNCRAACSPPASKSSSTSDQMTRMFLNCHGSLSSRSSGKSRPRSNSGVQSVYFPTTGPR